MRGLTHSPLGSWGLITNVIKCPLTTQVSHKLPGNHISLKLLYIKKYRSLIRFTIPLTAMMLLSHQYQKNVINSYYQSVNIYRAALY